jgi:DnaK suppressor protein
MEQAVTLALQTSLAFVADQRDRLLITSKWDLPTARFPMNTFDSSLAPRFSQLLVKREAELRAVLRSTDEMPRDAGEADAHDVTDFKDMASEESLSVVDEAQANHAAEELEQVLTARQRLHDQTYGDCLDCGQPIDLRRLEALPATPCCTACQAVREQPRPPATQT